MKERIRQQLRQIELDYQVTILLACESGSRAWGFPSRNSDYDVRFIYVHPRDRYLALSDPRDVIAMDLTDDLDISGWDIKKSLLLLRKANPSLGEWLVSPIVYLEKPQLSAPLKDLARRAFLPVSACHHYLALARSSLSKTTCQTRPTSKSYLYCLRALLCCAWIIAHQTQPPMLITDLLDEFLPVSQPLRHTIDQIIAAKLNGQETDPIGHALHLDEYLQTTLINLEKQIPKNQEKIPGHLFDEVFRTILGINE